MKNNVANIKIICALTLIFYGSTTMPINKLLFTLSWVFFLNQIPRCIEIKPDETKKGNDIVTIKWSKLFLYYITPAVLRLPKKVNNLDDIFNIGLTNIIYFIGNTTTGQNKKSKNTLSHLLSLEQGFLRKKVNIVNIFKNMSLRNTANQKATNTWNYFKNKKTNKK